MPLDTRRNSPANYVETNTDIGPKIRRRRFTAVPEFLTPPEWVFKEIEYLELMTFYRNVLKGGSETFMWASPLSDLGDVECRIVEAPVARVRVPGSGEKRVWMIELKIEVLP
jgi:hypothetical protein